MAVFKCVECQTEFRLIVVNDGDFQEAEFCPFCGEEIFEKDDNLPPEDSSEWPNRYYDFMDDGEDE